MCIVEAIANTKALGNLARSDAELWDLCSPQAGCQSTPTDTLSSAHTSTRHEQTHAHTTRSEWPGAFPQRNTSVGPAHDAAGVWLLVPRGPARVGPRLDTEPLDLLLVHARCLV